MKKFLSLLLALAMALTLVACGGGNTPQQWWQQHRWRHRRSRQVQDRHRDRLRFSV